MFGVWFGVFGFRVLEFLDFGGLGFKGISTRAVAGLAFLTLRW